jgi:hypothetical protein
VQFGDGDMLAAKPDEHLANGPPRPRDPRPVAAQRRYQVWLIRHCDDGTGLNRCCSRRGSPATR